MRALIRHCDFRVGNDLFGWLDTRQRYTRLYRPTGWPARSSGGSSNQSGRPTPASIQPDPFAIRGSTETSVAVQRLKSRLITSARALTLSSEKGYESIVLKVKRKIQADHSFL